MVEILAKDNIDEILEDVRHYVGETEDLPLVRIDDVIVSIGMDEDGCVYIATKDGKKSRTVFMEEPNPDYSSIKNAFDALIESIATKNHQ